MAMKLIRSALVVLVVLAVFDGTEQTCSRRDKSLHMKIYRETWCRDPVDTLVPLPVPEGYKFVMPSVVKLKRCSGQQCNKNLGEQCLAREESITTSVFKVKAYLSEDDSEAVCEEVEVEEHGACRCMCSKECGEGWVFKKQDCRCECDPDKMAECDERRFEDGFPVMWSEQECKCLCDPNQQEACSTGQIRNHTTCRCDGRGVQPEWKYDMPYSFEDNEI